LIAATNRSSSRHSKFRSSDAEAAAASITRGGPWFAKMRPAPTLALDARCRELLLPVCPASHVFATRCPAI
jgi:hypothetical protein